jgi:phage shock protein PspC (stress-responsive transcriptional regulator)
MMEQKKRLCRSRRERRIAGVIGGWARYLGVDPSLLRLGFVLLVMFTAFFPDLFLFPLMGTMRPLAPFEHLLSREGYLFGYVFGRAVYLFSTVLVGFGLAVFAYLLMALIMPPEPEPQVG